VIGVGVGGTVVGEGTDVLVGCSGGVFVGAGVALGVAAGVQATARCRANPMSASTFHLVVFIALPPLVYLSEELIVAV
jgi:hypothetical protein